MGTEVSEQRITSIFMVKIRWSKELDCSRWLSIYTRRDIPEGGNIHNHSCENLRAYINKLWFPNCRDRERDGSIRGYENISNVLGDE
jgi:hypothetical protein